ncbi:O-antigen ligase family protein [Actinomadura rugatobispora]|uniref:O-antigen ligase family protein n=1 Tax=Actinomadura rugatobispora TaxID=1994 RepID=A0ABW1AK82_9ACTN|nr:O-antigen ligase family protein [Actinomadura rugatobispora]
MRRALAGRWSPLVAAAALCVCVPPEIGATAVAWTARFAGFETFSDVLAVQVSAGDLAGLVLVTVAAVLVAARKVAPPPLWTLPAFGTVALAAGIATLCSQDIASSLPGYVRIVQLLVLVPLAAMTLVQDRTDGLVVAAAVVAVALAESSYGIWQALTRNGAAIGGETVRAVGTFGAGDVMALSIVAGFGVVFTLAFALAGPPRVRPFAAAALAVLGSALLLALSRGSWIAIGAAAGLVLLAYSRRLAMRTAATAAALAVVVVGGLGLGLGGGDGDLGGQTLAARAQSMTSVMDAPDQSVLDRYSLWTAARGMWGDHPVTGVGVKNFPAYRDSYAPIELSSAGEVMDRVNGYHRQPLLSPHSQYLLVLAEQGVVGLVGLLALFGALAYGVWRHRDPRDPLWLAAFGFLAGLLINFVYADISGASSMLVAIMIGLVAAGAATGLPRPGTEVAPRPRAGTA